TTIIHNVSQDRVFLRFHDSMHARNADIASLTVLNRGVYYLQRLTHVDGVDADPKEINSIKLKALRHVDSPSSPIACCKSPFDRHSERSEGEIGRAHV